MKKIMAVVLAVLMSGAVQAGDWGRYQGDEWPLPENMVTEADLKRHETARKWFIFAGSALLLGAVIANKNAEGLSRKASGIEVPMVMNSRTTPGGGIMLYPTADRGAADNKARIRSKSKAYRQGAVIGGLLATMCLSIAFSLRF